MLDLQKSSAQAASKFASEVRVEIVKEVIINDSAPSTRHHLTKRTTQDEIQARTHTVIVTKGRYYAPGAPQDDKEKPLHLRVTPGAHAGLVSTCPVTARQWPLQPHPSPYNTPQSARHDVLSRLPVRVPSVA